MIKFCKFHGFGNDYIVIEKVNIPAEFGLSELARAICNRHLGAGADGIAVLEKLSAEADFFCEIVNPDGSIASFSGNGTRCAVSYLYYKNLWDESSLSLKTKSGINNYKLRQELADGHYIFEAEIGKPGLSSTQVPYNSVENLETVIDQELIIAERKFQVSAVNVGNPVACTFVDNFDFDWRNIGREMEVHNAFPEKANIVFVKIVDRENIVLKIWERGVGETSSSGTCTSAAAVLSCMTERTGRKVSVHTDGGITEILWREDGEIVITGRADLAYCGEFFI